LVNFGRLSSIILAPVVDKRDQINSSYYYTPLGHKLRIFTLREAQFVTGGIISFSKYIDVPVPKDEAVFAIQVAPAGLTGR
jgi:hypothetical protein